MSYIGYDELGITAAVIAAALAVIVLAWNAVKAIHEWRAMVSKPQMGKIADHERRIATLESCCDEVRGKLESDYEWQQSTADMNRLLLRSVKGLMAHAIDGNDTAKLKAIEQEIDDYLLEHAK